MNKKNASRQYQQGSEIVEIAIIIPIFLIVFLGIADIGLGVLKKNALAEATAAGARLGSVRGSIYYAKNGNLTALIDQQNDAISQIQDEIKKRVSPYGVNLNDDNITVVWPDPNNDSEFEPNDPGQIVTVTSTYTFNHLIFGIVSTFTSTATMPISY